MITSGKKAMLPSERSKVWKVVTSVEHYTWRSDLRGTEILCENQFKFILCQRWTFLRLDKPPTACDPWRISAYEIDKHSSFGHL